MIFFLLVGIASSLPFPDTSTGSWTLSPQIDAPTESRSTETTIFLTWSQGAHSLEPLSRYEVQARYPTAISPNDQYLYFPKPTQDGYYPDRSIDRPWAVSWSDWSDVYIGMGRQYLFSVSQFTGLSNQRVFDFRVRAVTSGSLTSDWSTVVPAHTILEGGKDRFLVELVATGKNNPGMSSIKIAGVTIFSRRDKVGLTMAVVDRANFQLLSVDTFDTFNDRAESRRLASSIRACGPEKLVLIVSSHGWEKSFTTNLADAMEMYGAYYVGQWARVFDAPPIQPNPYADLTGTQSSDSFGHPYAFIGMFGLGMGNGFESIQLNTGHYLTTGKAEPAIIRLSFYYNYMFGKYMVGSEEMSVTRSADWFVKSQAPRPGTVHAPIPGGPDPISLSSIQPQPKYAPYIGTLSHHIEFLMEANETVVLDQFNTTNFGFEIRQDNFFSQTITDDPREKILITELEYVWGGPSVRYNFDGSEVLSASASTNTNRVCPDILPYLWMQGTGCSVYDDPVATATVPMLQYGIGIWPTVCAASRAGCGAATPMVSFSMISKPTISASVTVSTDMWIS
jgi:hypothetical protein